MYRVLWTEWSVNELTREWIDADSDSRRAITTASEQIHKRLQDDPSSVGESRPEGRRIDFLAPLAYTFRVRESERIVLVHHVWRIDHRRSR